MALSFLLEKGLAVTLGDDNSRLLVLMQELGAPPEAAEHVRQTLEAVPPLLCAADEALADPSEGFAPHKQVVVRPCPG